MQRDSIYLQLRYAITAQAPRRSIWTKLPAENMNSVAAVVALRIFSACRGLTGSSDRNEYSSASFFRAIELNTLASIAFLRPRTVNARRFVFPETGMLQVASFFILLCIYVYNAKEPAFIDRLRQFPDSVC